MKDKLLINVKEADGENYFDMEDFRPIYGDDLEKIEHYSISVVPGKQQLVIKFYDKDKNLVLPKDQE